MFKSFLLYYRITLLSLSLSLSPFSSVSFKAHTSSQWILKSVFLSFSVHLCAPPPLFQSPIHAVHETLPWMASLEMFCLRSFIPCFISIGSGHFSYFCSLMHPVSLCLDDYKSELREQLPLIAGSAAAGVVFIVSLVAISIVCSRWVGHYGTRRMTAACAHEDEKPRRLAECVPGSRFYLKWMWNVIYQIISDVAIYKYVSIIWSVVQTETLTYQIFNLKCVTCYIYSTIQK